MIIYVSFLLFSIIATVYTNVVSCRITCTIVKFCLRIQSIIAKVQ
jgi:hypothetical protein